jgi:DNA polymerase
MKAMGADKMGLTDAEITDIVERWRAKSPNIVKLWSGMEKAAMLAITRKRPVDCRHNMQFSYEDDCLFMRLPSGRRIAYQQPEIGENRFGGKSITYMGVNQTTKQWQETETYGGKLVENVVQATARDCLAVAMTRVSEMGYKIVMHVHDEMIVDVPVEDKDALERINAAMGAPIEWAPGLPLRGDGYTCNFYRKD